MIIELLIFAIGVALGFVIAMTWLASDIRDVKATLITSEVAYIDGYNQGFKDAQRQTR